MNWSKPISAWEIIFICCFLLIYAYYFLRTYHVGKRLGSPSRSILVKFLLRITYFGMMVVALLGPSFGITETEAQSTGKDIYLLVDLSVSMNTTDVSPSRLDKVKLELGNLIEQLDANRMGVIVFASQAYWQIPLTFDLSVVHEFIIAMDTQMMPNKGSNLNAPLKLLIEKLVDNNDNSRSQLVILLTDGENFGTVSTETKNALNELSTKVIMLGVGTETGGFVNADELPIKLEDGSMVVSKLDLTEMQELSNDLNADLFLLSDKQNDMSSVLDEINATENYVLDQGKLLVTNNKYSNFLLMALILASIDVLLYTKIFEI